MTDRDSIPQVHVDTRLGAEAAARLRGAFLTVLRRSTVATVVIGVAALGLGYLLAGMPGVYGALVGIGLAAFFLLTTVVVMVVTSDRSQTVVSAAIAGSWLLKTVVTMIAIVMIRDLDFYDPRVLLVTVAALVLGTLAVEMVTLARARIPLDLPEDRAAGTTDESDEQSPRN